MVASLTTVLTPMQKFVWWQATKIPPVIPSPLSFDIYRLAVMLLRYHIIRISMNYLIWFRYITGLMCFRLPTRHKLCTLYLLHQNEKY
uniref:Uncharacterized protein n=1 Tax=Lactuca sativa TaxID=4236 RepID=A0A9R1W7Q3_LACSA|nr:hypothetical protein LSAT_V11C200095910 [Lactuca sativa]